MVAKLGDTLFLAAVFGDKLDAIVIAGPITNLSLDSDWRRGVGRREFHRHLVAAI